MQAPLARSLTLGLILALAPFSGAWALTVGFEDLVAPPALNASEGLQYTNNDSSSYDGIVWDSRITVVGKSYEVNASPPAGPLFSGGAPGGGNYYITNGTGATSDPNTTYGNGITLTTNQVLQGAYFGSVEYYGYNVGEGASQISITAMNGSTALDTLNFTLVPNTQTGGSSNTAVAMTYFNTSAFSSLSGINSYVINRTPRAGDLTANDSNVGWVADNFTFSRPSSSVPEPTNEYLLLVLTLGFAVRLGLKLRGKMSSKQS